MNGMKVEKIILKKSPPLEFLFNEKSFQIINGADSESEGLYEYANFKSISFDKERTNWLFTILSYLLEFVLGVGGGSAYKHKKRLTIKQTDKETKVDLLDCEQKTIDQLITRLQKIKNSSI